MSEEVLDGKVIREVMGAGGIEVRRYRPHHAEVVYEAVDECRAELMPWMAWLGPNYSLDDCKTFAAARDENWGKGQVYSFVIFDANSGRVLGACGLSDIDRVNRRANLGYWVKTGETGKGVATTAARLVAIIALTDIGLQRIEIVASVENKASQRVAEKLGAAMEGVLRNRLRLQDRQHHAVSYSLTPEDLVGDGEEKILLAKK